MMDCIARGDQYSPEQVYSTWSNEKLLISSKSDDYQLIANCMEDGHSITTTWELVNEMRVEAGKEIVG